MTGKHFALDPDMTDADWEAARKLAARQMTDGQIIMNWQATHGVGVFPDEPGYAEYMAAMSRSVTRDVRVETYADDETNRV
jgi:hypothetical protein